MTYIHTQIRAHTHQLVRSFHLYEHDEARFKLAALNQHTLNLPLDVHVGTRSNIHQSRSKSTNPTSKNQTPKQHIHHDRINTCSGISKQPAVRTQTQTQTHKGRKRGCRFSVAKKHTIHHHRNTTMPTLPPLWLSVHCAYPELHLYVPTIPTRRHRDMRGRETKVVLS